jgi:hypothetical protein
VTAEEYELTQELMINYGRIFAAMPIEDFLAKLERADTVGPFLDPSLWMRGHKAMDEIREIAKGALAFKKSVQRAEAMREGRTTAREKR